MMSLYSTACYNIAMHSVLLLIRLQMKAGGIIAIVRRPTPLGDIPYKKYYSYIAIAIAVYIK